jgi:hypothetical protein
MGNQSTTVPLQAPGGVSHSTQQAEPVAWWYAPVTTVSGTLIVAAAATTIAIYKMRRDHQDAIRREQRAGRRKRIEQQISEFYTPLSNLLMTNAEIFKSFGPPSRREGSSAEDDAKAGQLWQYMITEAIIPNQASALKVLMERASLVDAEDTLERYTPLVTHFLSYKAFRHSPSTLHTRFSFPAGITDHVQQTLNRLRAELTGYDFAEPK